MFTNTSAEETLDVFVKHSLLGSLEIIDRLDSGDKYDKQLRKALIKVVAHYSIYGDVTNHPEVNEYLTKTLTY